MTIFSPWMVGMEETRTSTSLCPDRTVKRPPWAARRSAMSMSARILMRVTTPVYTARGGRWAS